MSGTRLIIGLVVMGIAVPLTIFFLLRLDTPGQLFTVAASTFLAWGVADLLANILEKPRLKDRSPHHALGEEWHRRTKADKGA